MVFLHFLLKHGCLWPQITLRNWFTMVNIIVPTVVRWFVSTLWSWMKHDPHYSPRLFVTPKHVQFCHVLPLHMDLKLDHTDKDSTLKKLMDKLILFSCPLLLMYWIAHKPHRPTKLSDIVFRQRSHMREINSFTDNDRQAIHQRHRTMMVCIWGGNRTFLHCSSVNNP